MVKTVKLQNSYCFSPDRSGIPRKFGDIADSGYTFGRIENGVAPINFTLFLRKWLLETVRKTVPNG